ncbi:hypothetical protein thsps117_25570 [Pseudomonas sp. No.117]
MPASLRTSGLVLVIISLAACSYLRPARMTSAYGEGYSDGCCAGDVSERDRIPRAHLQAEYFNGWTARFKTCKAERDREKWQKPAPFPGPPSCDPKYRRCRD